MKNPMTLFVMFSMNYPPDFVSQAFPNDNHLKAKWDNIGFTSYNESYGKMVKFWSLLSDNNRETLYNWITLNYEGK